MKYKVPVLIAAAGLLLGCGIGIYEGRARAWSQEDYFQRNTYGGGAYTEEMEAEIEGEKKKIEVTVEEKKYSRREAEKLMQETAKALDGEILGDNQSVDEIRKPMHLPEHVGDSPVAISWITDHPQILDWEGTLGEEIPQEGVFVTIQGELSLGESRQLYERRVKVFPQQLSREEQTLRKLQEGIEKENQGEDTGRLYLPGKVEGKTVRWMRSSSHTGLWVSLLAVLSAVLAAARQEEQKHKKEKERRELLLRDYPDIVGKLVLFLGAGMTIKGAFTRIAADYQKWGQCGPRPGYEEMAAACKEMEGGISEAEAYQRFGARCRLPCYKTLATLLFQNLKKGGRGLLELLEREAAEAEDDRIRNARIKGEQVSSKLLVPMFLMLLVVLVILMVPAYLTFY